MPNQSIQGTPLTIRSEEVQRKKRNLKSIQNILRESSLRKKFGNILSSLKTIGQRRESGLTSQNDRLQNLNRKNHMPRELHSKNQESFRTRALPEPNFKKKVNSQVSITIGQILNLTVTPKHYFRTSRSNSKGAKPSQTRMKTEEDNSRIEQNRARKDSPIREKGNGQVSREKLLEHRDSTGLFSILKILNNSVRQTSTNPEKNQSQEFSPGSHTSKLLEKIIKKSSRVNSKETYRSTNSSTGRVQAEHLSQNLDEKSNSRTKRSGYLHKPQVSKKNRKIESLIGKMYTETAIKWNISSQDLKRTQPQREQQQDSSKSRDKRKAGDSKANSKYSSYKSFDPLRIQLDKDSSPCKPLCRSQEKSSSYSRRSQLIPEPNFENFAPAQHIDYSPAQRSHLESQPNNKETTNQPIEKVAKNFSGSREQREEQV
jgi:hypothetical protein